MPDAETASTEAPKRPEHDLTRRPARTDTTLVASLPESLRYRVKRRLLGPPLVSDELAGQRLGKPTALAVLSSDVMSSSAYASEQMIRVLVPDRGPGRLLAGHPADRGHPGRPGRRDHLLPGRGPLLSQGGRLVRGEPGQLRAQHRPDRRGRPARSATPSPWPCRWPPGPTPSSRRSPPWPTTPSHVDRLRRSCWPTATCGASARPGGSSPSPPTSSSPTWPCSSWPAWSRRSPPGCPTPPRAAGPCRSATPAAG